MSDTIIKIDGLWKRYGLPPTVGPRQILSNLRHLRNPLWTDSDQGPWSLRDISLEINRGEVFGIIGRNGAGKSTLLKILAGVSKPTRGSVEVKGRIFPMIELNAGMHFDLSGRENVRLLGAVMGLTKRQIRMIEPDVEEFCELGEYFDMPVRTYSSGMLARLGFGVAMNIRADILLVDEVLSVGDYVFQKKAIQKMESLIRSGVTVLIVSHSPFVLEKLCGSGVYLKDGQVIALDGITNVLNRYLDEGRRRGKSNGMAQPVRQGTGDVTIDSCEVQTAHGGEVMPGDSVAVIVRYRSKSSFAKINIGVSFYDVNGILAGYFTNIDRVAIDIGSGEGAFRIDVKSLNLMPGVYSIDVKLSYAAFLIEQVSGIHTLEIAGSSAIFRNTGNRGIAFIEV